MNALILILALNHPPVPSKAPPLGVPPASASVPDLGGPAAGSSAARTAGSAAPATAAPALDMPKLRADMLASINRERAKVRGLKPLAIDDRLNVASQWIAEDNATRNWMLALDPVARWVGLDHRGSDLSWHWDRVIRYGYRHAYSGEVLTWIPRNWPSGQGVDQAVKGWMESPGHRAELLNRNVIHMGVGVAESKDGRRYFAVVTARPMR